MAVLKHAADILETSLPTDDAEQALDELLGATGRGRP